MCCSFQVASVSAFGFVDCVDSGFGTLDSLFLIFDLVFWILDCLFWIWNFHEFWILDIVFWILNFGFWILDFGFWSLGVRPPLNFIHLLFNVQIVWRVFLGVGVVGRV